MNMTGTFAKDFAQARPVANHCEELVGTAPRPEERAEHLAMWCRDLALELAQELGQLFSAGKLHVALAGPETVTGKEAFEQIGPVAVNSLLRCGVEGETVLLSLDYATAIALTDCSFGGEGNPPDQVPSRLPRSASMLAEQFARLIAQTIALTNASAERSPGDVLVRSESAQRLKPFGEEDDVALFRLTLAQGASAEWNAILAVSSERLDALLPGMDCKRVNQTTTVSAGDGTSGPFSLIPMRLDAVLGEVEMTLSQLERLAPGDEIPLSTPRELPLMMGEALFARGSIGTLDNQMALCLTRLAGERRIAEQGANP